MNAQLIALTLIAQNLPYETWNTIKTICFYIEFIPKHESIDSSMSMQLEGCINIECIQKHEGIDSMSMQLEDCIYQLIYTKI